jgi:hypothetical protein
MAIQLLVEGRSVRTVERITGIHRDAILKLLVVAGELCEVLLNSQIRNVPVKDVQADEIWSFVGMKEKSKKTRMPTMINWVTAIAGWRWIGERNWFWRM